MKAFKHLVARGKGSGENHGEGNDTKPHRKWATPCNGMIHKYSNFMRGREILVRRGINVKSQNKQVKKLIFVAMKLSALK